MEIEILYVTCSSEAESLKFSRELIELNLAACIQRFPVQSSYYWENNFIESEEWPILIKTTPDHVETIKNYIIQYHAYSIPSILHWRVNTNENFGQWVTDSVRNGQLPK